MNVPNQSHNSSLKSRVFQASSYTMFGYGFSQLMRLGSNLILTRLLVPEMFGVMTIVSVITIGLSLFSDFGLLQNIVNSKRGEETQFLNTAWTLQILRGLILFILMLFVGGAFKLAGTYGIFPEGSAYADPIIPEVIAVLSLTVLIPGFNSTKLLVATRKLYLGKVILIDVVSQALGIVVMIVWAYLNPTIWALVYGGIIASLTKTVLSHISIPGEINKIFWDRFAVHEIFHFGKWIFLSSILGFLINQGDKLLLGALVSASVLGIYSIALYLATAVKMILEQVFSAVFYPALSEIARERVQDLSTTYYKLRIRVDAISFFSAGFIFSAGNFIVNTLYDDRYSGAGQMISILSFSILTLGPIILADQCLLAIGKAKAITYMNVALVLALYIGIPMSFTHYGMTGALWVIALYPLSKLFISLYLMNNNQLLRIKNELLMSPLYLLGFLVGIGVESIFTNFS